MAKALCKMGYAVFSINYHMAVYTNAPYDGERTYCPWPACIADSMDAVSFVRQNADKYNIDADKICIIGSSAGGHLALLTAAGAENKQLNSYRSYSGTSCRVSCAVSLYGIADITQWYNGKLLMPLPYEQSQSEWALASPVRHISKKTPPLMLIHGDKDETVSINESLTFLKEASEKGADIQLITVADGKHSFDFSALSPQQFKTVTAFLKNHLRKEQT